jgi:hypothetical protein
MIKTSFLPAIEFSEVLQVVHGHVISKQMENSILQCTSMAIRENKAVTVGIVRVLWVASNKILPQYMG